MRNKPRYKNLKQLVTVVTLLLIYSGNATASPSEPLRFPELSRSINDQKAFSWSGLYGSPLRWRLYIEISSAGGKALQPGDYHLGMIEAFARGEVSEADSVTYELYCTDALVALCKDLIRHPEIDGMVSYDEVSREQDAADDAFIAQHIMHMHTIADLDSLLASCENASESYTVLLQALDTAMRSSNTAAVKKLRTGIALHRWIRHFHYDSYIIVNIPAAMLYYASGDSLLEMKVVAGKKSTKTPRFAAHCNQIILYPYWHVPRSIAVNELLPLCKRNKNTVNAMNLQVLNSKGVIVDPAAINWNAYNKNNFPYTFRQATGCDNALGVIKFNLTSPYSVYLHDTNFKGAFSLANRYLSHGCIRIEKPMELGEQLAPGQINEQHLQSCIRNQVPETLNIPPVPVFVIYNPVNVQSDSVIYYDDVYGLL